MCPFSQSWTKSYLNIMYGFQETCEQSYPCRGCSCWTKGLGLRERMSSKLCFAWDVGLLVLRAQKLLRIFCTTSGGWLRSRLLITGQASHLPPPFPSAERRRPSSIILFRREGHLARPEQWFWVGVASTAVQRRVAAAAVVLSRQS